MSFIITVTENDGKFEISSDVERSPIVRSKNPAKAVREFGKAMRRAKDIDWKTAGKPCVKEDIIDVAPKCKSRKKTDIQVEDTCEDVPAAPKKKKATIKKDEKKSKPSGDKKTNKKAK